MDKPDAQDKTTPASAGELLRQTREAREMSPREVADRLHWLPCYVGIIERDDYAALRRPAFARGYVRAYGKLLALDEARLMAAFDAGEAPSAPPRGGRSSPRPPVLGRVNGLAIGFGLLVLGLLVLSLWWWRGGVQPVAAQAAYTQPQISITGEV